MTRQRERSRRRRRGPGEAGGGGGGGGEAALVAGPQRVGDGGRPPSPFGLIKTPSERQYPLTSHPLYKERYGEQKGPVF